MPTQEMEAPFTWVAADSHTTMAEAVMEHISQS